MYINKAFIYGNLTRDPELKSLPSGVPVTSFSLATTNVWKNKDGQKQEDTQFHNIVVFGPMARNVAQYLKKGSSAFVEGRMQTRSWDTADGQKKYRTEVVADTVQFGPKKEGEGGGAPFAGGGNSQPAQRDEQPVPPPLDTIQYPEEDINPDDIPF